MERNKIIGMIAKHPDRPSERNERTDGLDRDIYDRSKAVPWYHEDPKGFLSSSMRNLLETYSKVPSDQVESHILAVREKAWQVYPYPCLGRFMFLDLNLGKMSVYEEVLSRMKSGEKFLDLGCCLGQEIRRLVAAGVPSENLYGADVETVFWELGYELFRDRETLWSRLIQADVFDEEGGLKRLKGTLDIINAVSFFHLFRYERQVQASKNVARLLKRQKGSMIVGRQVGSIEPGEVERRTSLDGSMYRHDLESFRKMWTEIGDDLRLKFDVEGEMLCQSEALRSFHPPETRLLRFAVRLV